MTLNFLFKPMFAVALVLSASAAQAECARNLGFPILVVSEGAQITDPFGGEVRTAEYLESFQANSFVPRIDDNGQQLDSQIEIDLGDGQVGLISLRNVFTFTGNACVTERMSMRALPPRYEGDEDNNLQVKAFIGQREIADPSETNAGVAFRAAPNREARILVQRPRYTLGYVFAHSYDERSRSDWYLISAQGDVTYAVNDDGSLRTNVDDNILGWVSDREMVIWSQRQAVYPRSSDALGVISRDAELSDAGLSQGAEVRWVDEAATDRARAILKYSVLRSLPDLGVYEVAYPQPALFAEGQELPRASDGSTSGGAAIVEDDIRNILDLLQDEAKVVDVLFVLDNSESMEPYREAVIQGIADVATLPAADSGAMRIAVSMFGDVFDTAEDYRSWAGERGGANPSWEDQMRGTQRFQYWLRDLAAPSEFPTANSLQQRFGGSYADPQGDRPESGLAGLDLAMRTTNWSESSVRLVVYIGDDQSRPISGLDADGSIRQVAETLKNFDAVLMAINVAGNDRTDNFFWINQVEQVGAVADDLKGRGGLYEPVVVAHDGQIDDIREARTAITEVLGALFVIREAGTGQIDLDRICEIAFQNNLSCNVPKSLLESLVGDDLSAIEELEARTDLLSSGYYPIDDGALFVTLSEPELNGLRNAISTACVGMQLPSGLRRDLENMSEELTQAFLGETRDRDRGADGETLPEFYARLTNLPANYFSIFGDLTLDEFIDFVQSSEDKPEAFRQIQRELCVSSELMTRVLGQRWVTRDALDATFDEDFQAFDVFENRELKRFDWRWGVGGGLQVVYLPQDFFPASVE